MAAARPVAARYSSATIPTSQGPVRVVVYREDGHVEADLIKEHVALVVGDVGAGEPVLARVHSECITSEVFGSLKCDCREQLDAALSRVHARGQGVVVYLRQEGRGIGLGNKIRAYALQAQGRDTVDANEDLGFGADLRTYGLAAAIFADLGIEAVELMTNNPRKVEGLVQAGLTVTRVAHEVDANEHSADYLRTKRARFGHLLELE